MPTFQTARGNLTAAGRQVPSEVRGLRVSRVGDAAETSAEAAGSLPPLERPKNQRETLPRAPSRYAPSWLGPGQPLDPALRRRFEARLDHSFADIRIHDDTRANASAIALQARAYAVGRHVAFAPGYYEPTTEAGFALLGHELAHVRRQAGEGTAIDRAPMRDAELARLDRELAAGVPLTQSNGEIGAAADAGTTVPPGEDTSLPIVMRVYRAAAALIPTTGTPAVPSAPSAPAPPPGPAGTRSDAGVPYSDAAPTDGPPVAAMPAEAPTAVGPTSSSPPPAKTPPTPPPQRALVVGGVHGDERGPLQLVDALDRELAAGARRDFDTFVIPRMNPWGVANGARENRRGVDLNRNFPGLRGFPAAAGPVPAEQPEVRAVRRVIEILRPVRILALHAIGGAEKGGVFADPVEGAARDLAARMAYAMGPANVRGNVLRNGAFSARYPESASVSVTTSQSSLGAWASAPTAVGGRGTAVITHEVPDKPALAATGSRSVASIMPGLREFLVSNGGAASAADGALRAAVTDAFLTGEQTTPAEARLLADISGVVNSRFADMAAHYSAVWLPANRGPGLPPRLSIVGGQGVRRFPDQAAIVRGQLGALTATSADAQIRAEIERVLTTRSMPGFSRHHWGTDIDIVSADRVRWTGTGDLVALIPFIRDHAPRFGFFNPYAGPSGTPASGGFPSPAAPHYLEEPWHLSYAPIATVLQAEWARRITGAVLDGLVTRTAAAIRGPIPQATMERVLRGMGLTSYQTNVASPP